MQIMCSSTSKSIIDDSCQSTVPKILLHLYESVSSLRGRGTETKKERETERRGMRDEGRRASRKLEIERCKERDYAKGVF